jgi:carbonic anhydrase
VRHGWITSVLLFIAVVLLPLSSRAQWKTPWDYAGAKGAEHWGDLDPDYALCKTGKEQSPLDIRHAEKVALPAIRFE